MIWGYPLFRKSPNSEHSNIASPVTHRPRFGRPVFDCWYRVAGLNVSPLSHMLRGYFSKKMKMILMGKYGIIWDYVSSQWEIHYLMCFSTGFFGCFWSFQQVSQLQAMGWPSLGESLQIGVNHQQMAIG